MVCATSNAPPAFMYSVMPVALRMWLLFFFFQAEDGIRDWSVTGVQTCALPIFGSREKPFSRRYALLGIHDRARNGGRLGRLICERRAPNAPDRFPMVGARQPETDRKSVV